MDKVPTPRPAVRYVAAARLFTVLRTRFGCVDMGWRDETSWYWVTPNGVPFEVAEPAPDANGPIPLTGSRRELYFSYDYARELVRRVREIMGSPTAARRLAGI